MTIRDRKEIQELQEMGYEISCEEEVGNSIWVYMTRYDEILTVEIQGVMVWVNGTYFDDFIEEGEDDSS